MYKTRTPKGRNNIAGENIVRIRKAMLPKMSQRKLAELMQIHGMDIDKNGIRRIENGERFATDIEIVLFARTLNVPIEQLLIE
jgi:transcriptional regulator with XRE-family HTH domain